MKVDYNSLASKYARYRQALPEVVLGLIKTGDLGPASKVLEVGCGTGNYLIVIQKAIHCTCWGIEPSEQMLAKARKRSPRIRFSKGQAEQIDFPSETFHLVFSVDVIHHVGDRPAFFREAFRVLKPSGKVCTVTDSEQIIRNRQPLSVYFPETIAIELQRYPRIPDLRSMMAIAGFTHLQEMQTEGKYEITDIERYRNKAFSSLHLISEEAFTRGIQQMEKDLQSHPIAYQPRYLLLWGVK